MTVSDWWMLVSFYQNVLALPVAIVLVVLLLRAKTRRRRVTLSGLLVLAFLPHIQLFAGNLYFDYLCRTQAGEFIYRTVDNVEGILQMRPRDGSKDYFDRMAMGDIPEDPWGHTNAEAQSYRAIYVGPPGSGRYLFIESSTPTGTFEKFSVHVNDRAPDGRALSLKPVIELVSSPQSRFGYTWAEETSFSRRLLNIYLGRVQVVNLVDKSILGEKVGVLKLRPYRVCPSEKSEEFISKFVLRVLRPASSHD